MKRPKPIDRDQTKANGKKKTTGRKAVAPKLTDEVREYFRAISALGGSKGGYARAKVLTAEERSAIARKAALARIAKYGQISRDRTAKPTVSKKKQAA